MTEQGGRTLLVASTGGHLQELVKLQPRLCPSTSSHEWVTFDDPQSRSLLSGESVHHVPYVPPRGYFAAASVAALAYRIVRSSKCTQIVSTGAGLAVPLLAAGRLQHVDCHYIESAARADGPSMTGKIVSRIPGVRLYAQYERWAEGPWAFQGSVFDAYRSQHLPSGATDRARRVVVTLGTMRTYDFRRAVQRLVQILPRLLTPDAEILWQVGSTDVSGLPIRSASFVSAEMLRGAVAAADLVVAHAGVGSALTALDLGKCPVLLARRKQHGEHVDDHQQLIAAELANRGLAVSPDVNDLEVEHLRFAMRVRVDTDAVAAPFRLRAS